MRVKIILALLCISTLSHCSSAPPALAKFNPAFDFSSAQSYRVMARNTAFGEIQSMSDATRNSIEIAIEKSFDKLGFRYESEADIVIGYHYINRLSELKKYNKTVKYCSPCLHAGEASIYKKAWEMSSGSLVLDVISQGSNRSVWRSVYALNVKPKDNSLIVQDKMTTAIQRMLLTLPKSGLSTY